MTAAVDVTIMIAAWKARDFIRHAIRSALSQDGVGLEVIVVDDCSPDDTSAAALEAGEGDPRLKVVRTEKNGGPSAARNRAIELAAGRYVAVLDADDSLAPGRLAHLVAVGDAKDADIIVDNIVRVNAAGEAIDDGPFLTGAAYEQAFEIDLRAYVDSNIFMSGEPATGYLKPLFRTDALRRMGIEYDVALRNSEDYYLVADMLAMGAKMVFDPFEGYLYRVDAGSISHRLKPDLTQALIDAETAFQARHADRLDDVQKRALKSRLARLGHAHAYIRFIELMKARRLLGAFGALASRPSAFSFVVFQLSEVVRQRLAARRLLSQTGARNPV